MRNDMPNVLLCTSKIMPPVVQTLWQNLRWKTLGALPNLRANRWHMLCTIVCCSDRKFQANMTVRVRIQHKSWWNCLHSCSREILQCQDSSMSVLSCVPSGCSGIGTDRLIYSTSELSPLLIASSTGVRSYLHIKPWKFPITLLVQLKLSLTKLWHPHIHSSNETSWWRISQ
jgi:hypothetical protein